MEKVTTKIKKFRVSPNMRLWQNIEEILKLKQMGVLDEECPSSEFWHFTIIDESKIPAHIMETIIKSDAAY